MGKVSRIPTIGDYTIFFNSLFFSCTVQDTDRLGSDFDNFDLPRPSPEMCRGACEGDAQCKAWTYVRPDVIQGTLPHCWLKEAIPEAVPNDCCISGVMWEQGVDRPGSDLANFDLDKDDPALCQEACFLNPECKAWTYVHRGIQGAQPRCWLKNAIPEAVPNDCCISGTQASLEPPDDNPEPANVQGITRTHNQVRQNLNKGAFGNSYASRDRC